MVVRDFLEICCLALIAGALWGVFSIVLKVSGDWVIATQAKQRYMEQRLSIDLYEHCMNVTILDKAESTLCGTSASTVDASTK